MIARRKQHRRRGARIPFTAGALLIAVAPAAAACSSATQAQSSEITLGATSDSTTIVVNAEVYTLDDTQPWAESFAYDANGVIIAVGTEDEVADVAGDDPAVINAGGQLVLPGFQDAHVHVPEAGINLEVCFMPAGLSLGRYEEVAADCAQDQPDADWVRAAGASLFNLRATDELPIDVLDRAVPDRPALVLDDLGHAVWTNTLGLEAAGVTAAAADPQGGGFHRNADGRLTGLLLEDAQQLVRNAAAIGEDEKNYRGLLLALDELAENGVTTISDAGGYWGQDHPAVWQQAAAEGALTVRARNTLYVYPNLPVDRQLASLAERFSDDPDSMLQFDTAKVYVDGILDLGTAWLLDPYDVPVDARYPSGFTYFTEEQLRTYVAELHEIGFRINFHTIGDAAVRDALDAIEAIDDDPAAVADRRHRTTHTYLVHPADVGRFAELGVIADFQQSDDAIATEYHDYLAEFIGDRAYDLIPTAALVDADATVILSSDWDAGPLPPLGTIERSLTRDANAMPDLATAIAASTIDAAYALGHDDVTGSIAAGKFADFVIIDQPLFDLAVEDIDSANVVFTAVGGRPVHKAPGFGQ